MLTPNIKAFYNEIDPYCCAWLSNLMDAGLITPGKIDDRSIKEITGSDVAGYERVHFFAGIAGWDYALNLANWGSRFVWTGSCPCQPFSEAGKQQAQNDARHLWPIWSRIIGECRPASIFGEQVADAITFGWLDEVAYDLEEKDYAVASAVLPACSIGSPHKRDRLFFVADAGRADATGRNENLRRIEGVQPVEEIRKLSDWNGGINSYGRLDDGIPSKLAKAIASGFGNAIVPQLAAEFIIAFGECRP